MYQLILVKGITYFNMKKSVEYSFKTLILWPLFPVRRQHISHKSENNKLFQILVTQ